MRAREDADAEISELLASLRESRRESYTLFNVFRQRSYLAEDREKALRREVRDRDKSLERLERRLASLENTIQRLWKSKRWKLSNLAGGGGPYPPVQEALEELRRELEEARKINLSHSGSAPTIRLEDQEASLQIPTFTPTVDVVVCVHNALEDVRACLASVQAKSPKMRNLILIDDGSGEETADFLETFASRCPFPVELWRNPQALGYTCAVNQGLRRSQADWVVLLNSDTVVTWRWLETLLACGESDDKIGLVGPLSNSATWQSIPERFDDDGDWCTNPLPDGLSADDIALSLQRNAEPTYPRVPILNGFCLMLRRQAINAVGEFDEASFPKGYGEENDYCLRARAAGFELAVCDTAYIHHATSRSYSHERRRKLSQESDRVFHAKHGKQSVLDAVAALREDPDLARGRERFSEILDGIPAPRALFLLPFRGSGGGTLSVLQQGQALRDLGAEVQFAIRLSDERFYRERFPEIDALAFYPYASEADVIRYAGAFDVAVATLYASVPLLDRISRENRTVLPAYYIQDYEPLFFPEDDQEHQRARESYERIPGALNFAMTKWLRDRLHAEHDLEMAAIPPCIDTDRFHVDSGSGPGSPDRDINVLRVTAMVRPSTPVRSPELTVRVLNGIRDALGDRVSVSAFGCAPEDPFWATHPLQGEITGELSQDGVADHLRRTDVFLDLSRYQAFGRTGLEAMACGCACVLTDRGGILDYAKDGENCRLVDIEKPEEVLAATLDLLQDDAMRRSFVDAGIAAAPAFTMARSAAGIRQLFEEQLAARSKGGNGA